MACVDSDNFSANDLALFIESMEQISRMESMKRQRHQRNRSHNLMDTLCNLDQEYHDEISTTLSSTDQLEDESIMESFEEKHIGYNSTCLLPNQYYAVDYDHTYYNQPDDFLSCHNTIYSLPYDGVSSTNLDECAYESLDLQPEEHFNHQYEEPSEVLKSAKSKRNLSIFGLVRKKYKKCFSSKTNNWHKSDSWTKLSVL